MIQNIKRRVEITQEKISIDDWNESMVILKIVKIGYGVFFNIVFIKRD